MERSLAIGAMDETLDLAQVPKKMFMGNIIGAFSRALSDKMDRAVTEATGMSTSASYTIVQIGSEPNSTIDELRKMLALEHSSLVRMLDRLEKLDMIVRNRGVNGDKRSVSITLTETGEQCFSTINAARNRILDQVVETLDDDEQDQIFRLIRKMSPKVVDAGDDQHYVCRLCNLEACPQEICPINLAHPESYEEYEVRFRREPKYSCLNGNSGNLA